VWACFARLRDKQELDSFEDELADRFGELPQQAQLLFDRARLQIMAKAVKVQRFDAGPAAIALSFPPGAEPPPRFSQITKKNERLLLTGDFGDKAARIQSAEELLTELTAN
jgi:transcription-repair coupling factor (superfamily II helicase)